VEIFVAKNLARKKLSRCNFIDVYTRQSAPGEFEPMTWKHVHPNRR